MTRPTPTARKCLLCDTPVYDQAALCVDCEADMEAREDGIRPAWLDALAPVRREATRAQRKGGR